MYRAFEKFVHFREKKFCYQKIKSRKFVIAFFLFSTNLLYKCCRETTRYLQKDNAISF